MPTKKRIRGNPLPIIMEKHPNNYKGYPFITLIQYRDQDFLSIIDNTTNKMINAYVLDLCGPTGVDEEQIIDIASNWYYTTENKYPISFEFSKLGLSDIVKCIYKSFAVGFVTRVIGPLPQFDMSEVKSVKRRKRKPILSNIACINAKDKKLKL